MPSLPSFVNGFVQISAVIIAALVTCDGAGFYQLVQREYSFSAIKFT